MLTVVQEALTFDDVLLLPAYSNVLPKDVCLKTKLTIEREISEDYLQQLNDDVILARNFNVVVDAGNGVAGP